MTPHVKAIDFQLMFLAVVSNILPTLPFIILPRFWLSSPGLVRRQWRTTRLENRLRWRCHCVFSPCWFSHQTSMSTRFTHLGGHPATSPCRTGSRRTGSGGPLHIEPLQETVVPHPCWSAYAPTSQIRWDRRHKAGECPPLSSVTV